MAAVTAEAPRGAPTPASPAAAAQPHASPAPPSSRPSPRLCAYGSDPAFSRKSSWKNNSRIADCGPLSVFDLTSRNEAPQSPPLNGWENRGSAQVDALPSL